MTVTRRTYDAMPAPMQALIDRAFVAAHLELKAAGITPLANDDRAERVVEALALYVEESKS